MSEYRDSYSGSRSSSSQGYKGSSYGSSSGSSRRDDYKTNSYGSRDNRSPERSSGYKRSYEDSGRSSHSNENRDSNYSAPKRFSSFGSSAPFQPLAASSEPFEKNFYVEHPALKAVSDKVVDDFMRENVIIVRGNNVPK